MRWMVVASIGCLAPLAGCNLVHYAGHNLVREPVDRANERKLTHRLKSEARVAWQEVCHQYPARTFSHGFADGFQDGYADQLQNGGPPQAPAVPPPRYRSHPNAFTPAGHALARDYLIGFQYGAEVACSTGRREFLTVPILLPNEKPADPPINLVKFPPPPDAGTELPTMPPPRPLVPTLDKPPIIPPVPSTPTSPARPDPLPLPLPPTPVAPPSSTSTPLPLPPMPALPGVPIPFTAPPALPPAASGGSGLPLPAPVIPASGTSEPVPDSPRPYREPLLSPPLPPASSPN